MVSKCANPECAAPFRYFHLGKLYRLEIEAGVDRRRSLGNNEETEKHLRRIEFYWLCEKCAGKMTLAFEKGAGVSVRESVLRQAAGF